MSRMFDVIRDIHMQLGHAGRNKMLAECQRRYYNVHRVAIEIYLKTCKSCELKRARPRDKTVTRPILTDDVSRRAQIDLIVWTSERSAGFGYILNSQDYLQNLWFYAHWRRRGSRSCLPPPRHFLSDRCAEHYTSKPCSRVQLAEEFRWQVYLQLHFQL